MRKERGFKKRYLLIPVFFFLAMLGWIFHSLNFQAEQELYKKIKVNNLAVLYVTQVSAGAMTSFTYHYYLYDAKKNQANFMAHLEDETPFMITNDDNVTVFVKDGQVYLHVRGDIYSFRNTTSLTRMHLTASPY